VRSVSPGGPVAHEPRQASQAHRELCGRQRPLLPRPLPARANRSPRDPVRRGLKRLPLIDREGGPAGPETLRLHVATGCASIMFLTSGSSGTPLPVFHDPYSLLPTSPTARESVRLWLDSAGKSLGYRELYILLYEVHDRARLEFSGNTPSSRSGPSVSCSPFWSRIDRAWTPYRSDRRW